ncbi:MAG: MlaD family protein [Alistipes sp.]|nr:MlaD family protein [Alistipes sp.]
MKREAKIGIFAVVMLIAAWAGVRFLKGFDIFSRNSVYYAAYDQINGVQTASPIMMKGVKIGTVTGISFDPQRSDNVVLQLTVKRQYHIPTDSEAKIFSNGLMGAKAIEITYGSAHTYLEKGDTLRSSRDRDLMDVAGSELEFFKQKISQVTGDLSRTLTNLNNLMEANTQNITGTLGHLNTITGDMAGILDAEKQNLKVAVDNLTAFSAMLGENAPRVDSIVGSMNRITAELADAGFARQLSDAVGEVNGLLEKIQSGEGTVGKLMTDAALYDSLTEASDNLASLLANLEQYPGRYVHFSLFGRSPEKMQEKADWKAAKAAARAERDSLKKLQ